jgi:hypothetical protein
MLCLYFLFVASGPSPILFWGPSRRTSVYRYLLHSEHGSRVTKLYAMTRSHPVVTSTWGRHLSGSYLNWCPQEWSYGRTEYPELCPGSFPLYYAKRFNLKAAMTMNDRRVSLRRQQTHYKFPARAWLRANFHSDDGPLAL